VTTIQFFHAHVILFATCFLRIVIHQTLPITDKKLITFSQERQNQCTFFTEEIALSTHCTAATELPFAVHTGLDVQHFFWHQMFQIWKK
jgi:hypothetical protein